MSQDIREATTKIHALMLDVCEVYSHKRDNHMSTLLYEVACAAASQCITAFCVDPKALMAMLSPALTNWNDNKQDAVLQGALGAVSSQKVCNLVVHEWLKDVPEPALQPSKTAVCDNNN